MAHTNIATDFLDYISVNWCESTISKPTTLKVMNFNRDRQIQGYKTGSALLVHRGELQFVPLDIGYESRVWGTDVLLQSTSADTLEDYIIEFMRTINAWEAAGGGVFTTNSLVFTAMEPVVFPISAKNNAVGELVFYSKQGSRNV